jgi:hypothetical protein
MTMRRLRGWTVNLISRLFYSGGDMLLFEYILQGGYPANPGSKYLVKKLVAMSLDLC